MSSFGKRRRPPWPWPVALAWQLRRPRERIAAGLFCCLMFLPYCLVAPLVAQWSGCDRPARSTRRIELAERRDPAQEHAMEILGMAVDMAQDEYCFSSGDTTPMRRLSPALDSPDVWTATSGMVAVRAPVPWRYILEWRLEREAISDSGARSWFSCEAKQAFDAVMHAHALAEWRNRTRGHLPSEVCDKAEKLFWKARFLCDADAEGSIRDRLVESSDRVKWRVWLDERREGYAQYTLSLEDIAGEYRLELFLSNRTLDCEDGPWSRLLLWFIYRPEVASEAASKTPGESPGAN